VKKNIGDLRDELFATIEALRDEKNPMDLARARQVADVARVIVDTAKVEVDFLKVRGEAKESQFLLDEQREKASAISAVPPRQLKQV